MDQQKKPNLDSALDPVDAQQWWNPLFLSRQEISKLAENLPYLADLHSRGEDGDPRDASDDDESDLEETDNFNSDDAEATSDPGGTLAEEEPIRVFMRPTLDTEDPDPCTPQADTLEDICCGSSLEELESDKWKGDSIALLDEGCFVGDQFRRREYEEPGPLTAQDVYKCLSQKQFLQDSRHTRSVISSPSRTSSFDSQGTKIGEDECFEEEECSSDRDCMIKHSHTPPANQVDAERRSLFVTNLDKWIVQALIHTVPNSQAAILRTALYKHFAFETTVDVNFPTHSGVPMFELSFHLPHLAFRKGGADIPQARKTKSGDLRQSHNVSFLNWHPQGEAWFLHEAQVSCIIAGFDEWRNFAWCWVDTYFDRGKGESVDRYYNDELVNGGAYRPDPFTRGTRDANMQMRDSRRFFLAVLLVRIQQVCQEWEEVVKVVTASVREYNEQWQELKFTLTDARTLPDEETTQRTRFRDWIVKVRRLVKVLRQQLDHTVDESETFCDIHAVYFQNLPSQDPARPRLLHDIKREVRTLAAKRKKLVGLAERCDDFAHDLEIQVGIESSEMSKQTLEMSNRHHDVAEQTRQLNIIMLIFGSLALAASSFTVEQAQVKLIPSRMPYFLIIFVVVSAIHGLLLLVLRYLYEGQFRKGIESAMGCQKWNRAVRQRMFGGEEDREVGD